MIVVSAALIAMHTPSVSASSEASMHTHTIAHATGVACALAIVVLLGELFPFRVRRPHRCPARAALVASPMFGAVASIPPNRDLFCIWRL